MTATKYEDIYIECMLKTFMHNAKKYSESSDTVLHVALEKRVALLLRSILYLYPQSAGALKNEIFPNCVQRWIIGLRNAGLIKPNNKISETALIRGMDELKKIKYLCNMEHMPTVGQFAMLCKKGLINEQEDSHDDISEDTEGMSVNHL